MSFLAQLWPIPVMLGLILAILIWALFAEDYGGSFKDDEEDFD